MSEQKKVVAKVKFVGKCKWACIHPGQERPKYDCKPEEKDDRFYSIAVECSQELFDRLKKAGIPRLTELKEEEGINYIRLRATKIKGEYIFEDPKVTDSDDNPITDQVGNGSDVEVIAYLEPIKGRNGKVLRLKEVKVINLVPYESNVEIVDFDTGEVEEGKKATKKPPVDDNEFF